MKIISILYFNNCVLVLLGPSFLENVVTLYSCLVSILCPYSCLDLIYHQNSIFIYCPSIPPEIRACSQTFHSPLEHLEFWILTTHDFIRSLHLPSKHLSVVLHCFNSTLTLVSNSLPTPSALLMNIPRYHLP